MSAITPMSMSMKIVPESKESAETPPKERSSFDDEMKMRLEAGAGDPGRNIVHDLSRVKYLLNPNGQLMRRWDMLMMILLVFTATMTPYEVAFLMFEVNDLFFLNRFVDFFFLVDLLFQFFLPIMVRESTTKFHDSDMWNVSRGDIAKQYLRSWFLIDFISIFPFDSMQLALEKEGENNATGKLRLLRILRCARLVKLLRTMRIGRLLSRWQQRLNISFRALHLCKFLMGGITTCHWIACVWRTIPSIEMRPEDWITKYYGTGPLDPSLEHLQTPSQLYITSLYFSVMTLTTIGYGDVTPHTEGELVFAIFAMALGASTYAYLVGDVCGEIGNGDPLGVQFRQKMDCVKSFMEAHGLPEAMRHKLKVFFHSSEELMRNEMHKTIIDDLSPTLRGEVIAVVHAKWLSKVRLLKVIPADEKIGFVSALVTEMQAVAYARDDYILRRNDLNDNIFIVQMGTVLRADLLHAKTFDAGDVFCADVIVSRRHTPSRYSWVAVSYVILHVISAGEVHTILADARFVGARKQIRKQAFKQLLTQQIGQYAEAYLLFRTPEVTGVDSEYVPAEHIKTKRYMDELRKREERGDIEEGAVPKVAAGEVAGSGAGGAGGGAEGTDAVFVRAQTTTQRGAGRRATHRDSHRGSHTGDSRLRSHASPTQSFDDSDAMAEVHERLDQHHEKIEEVLRLLRGMAVHRTAGGGTMHM